jgi:hypothetical protein
VFDIAMGRQFHGEIVGEDIREVVEKLSNRFGNFRRNLRGRSRLRRTVRLATCLDLSRPAVR